MVQALQVTNLIIFILKKVTNKKSCSNSESSVQSQASPCGIYGIQNGIETGNTKW